MATYIVRGGDSLSKIAKKLGIKGGWPALYEQNRKVIGSNPNYIRPGWKLSYNSPSSGGTTTSSASSTTTTTTTKDLPSTETGKTTAAAVKGGDKESFYKKYGTLEELTPTAMFQAFGEERINPDQLRQAVSGVIDYDRSFAAGGGYMSGRMQADRQAYINSLERARKTAVDQYVQQQKKQYADWYGQQLKNYTTAKNPTDFQLDAYGIELPSTYNQETYKPETQYSYTSPFQMTDLFKYGGYSAPSAMYGMPTPIS
jgi:LysM repeat protein